MFNTSFVYQLFPAKLKTLRNKWLMLLYWLWSLYQSVVVSKNPFWQKQKHINKSLNLRMVYKRVHYCILDVEKEQA